jgi:hypothetical protein
MAFEFQHRPLSELPSLDPEEVQEWLDDRCSPGDYDVYVSYGDDDIVTQAVLCVAVEGGCQITVWQEAPLTDTDKDEVVAEMRYNADGTSNYKHYE